MGRALITGVTGQDGSYLAEQLVRDGWEVHGLVHSTLGSTLLPAEVAPHIGELSDEDSLRGVLEAVEPNIVFNLAGISSVARSWQEPVLTGSVSGLAVVKLLEMSWRLQERLGREVRFVQASSSEIFGVSSDVPQSETTPIRPVTPYGAAKAFAHHAVEVYRCRGLFASSAILYNHESPRRPETFVTRKITLGAARIAAGLSDSLALGNLDVRRDWGWAPDYTECLLRMAIADEPGDFVVATGESHSIRDFVTAAFQSAGLGNWTEYVHLDTAFARPVDAPEMRGDATKASNILGWKPTVAFEEIVNRMVESDLKIAMAQAGQTRSRGAE